MKWNIILDRCFPIHVFVLYMFQYCLSIRNVITFLLYLMYLFLFKIVGSHLIRVVFYEFYYVAFSRA